MTTLVMETTEQEPKVLMSDVEGVINYLSEQKLLEYKKKQKFIENKKRELMLKKQQLRVEDIATNIQLEIIEPNLLLKYLKGIRSNDHKMDDIRNIKKETSLYTIPLETQNQLQKVIKNLITSNLHKIKSNFREGNGSQLNLSYSSH